MRTTTPPLGVLALNPDLRTMIEEASDPIFVTDLELEIQWTNARGCEALGRELDQLLPDGDAELDDDAARRVRVLPCDACGGVLKPNLVFFGDSVPRPIVEASHAIVREAEALLIVGTSLAVYSGLRFVRAAAERRIPIAIVNRGESRGDPLATVRVDARAGELLPALARQLAARAGT